MKLGEQLKKSGIKQSWLADQLGVHPNQVTRWIKGINEPNVENYKKIRKILRSLRRIKWNIAELSYLLAKREVHVVLLRSA